MQLYIFFIVVHWFFFEFSLEVYSFFACVFYLRRPFQSISQTDLNMIFTDWFSFSSLGVLLAGNPLTTGNQTGSGCVLVRFLVVLFTVRCHQYILSLQQPFDWKSKHFTSRHVLISAICHSLPMPNFTTTLHITKITIKQRYEYSLDWSYQWIF